MCHHVSDLMLFTIFPLEFYCRSDDLFFVVGHPNQVFKHWPGVWRNLFLTFCCFFDPVKKGGIYHIHERLDA